MVMKYCRLAAGQVNQLLHFLLIRNHAVRAEAKHRRTATVAGSGVLLIHIHRLRQLTVRQAIDESSPAGNAAWMASEVPDVTESPTIIISALRSFRCRTDQAYFEMSRSLGTYSAIGLMMGG